MPFGFGPQDPDDDRDKRDSSAEGRSEGGAGDSGRQSG